MNCLKNIQGISSKRGDSYINNWGWGDLESDKATGGKEGLAFLPE